MAADTDPKLAINTEVLVIGGGMVGGILACALDGAGIAAVVVDRQAPSTVLDPAFDGRASAIALASQRALTALDLWPALSANAAPILDIRVSEGESLLFLHFDHKALGGTPFGYMVENRMLRRALHQRLPDLASVGYVAPAELVSLDLGATGVEAALADGRTIRARLAVGADGRNSWARRQAGIRVTRWSYDQVGVVCAVAHERPHRNVAHERFLPAGPFAILPLKNNRSSIVWTERADLAPAIMALDDSGFEAELSLRFGDFLGTVNLVGGRWSHALSLQFAASLIARRLALVGDAAHGMHPIAGQGLNMGIRDVAALVEVLCDARRLGLDLGEAGVLDRYQRWRRFDSALMLAATDGLNRLFSNTVEPLRLIRDTGLAIVHRLPALKRIFARQAMGLAGDLPRLLKGRIP